MLNTKRAFVSLGPGHPRFCCRVFSLLFILRLLNSPQWMYTVILWILVWPTRLLGVLYNSKQELAKIAFVLSIGLITDIAILSPGLRGANSWKSHPFLPLRHLHSSEVTLAINSRAPFCD